VSSGRTLTVEPLTREAFAPFGDVIEADEQRTNFLINDGNAKRFDDLAEVDASTDNGRPCISIVRVKPYALPLPILMLERHLLGSQAFVPLAGKSFLVVVAPGIDTPSSDEMRCFLAVNGQGVNYRRGTWHHPVIGIDEDSEFLVVDRRAASVDCAIFRLDDGDRRRLFASAVTC
jgi:ureidoglycolate lyase